MKTIWKIAAFLSFFVLIGITDDSNCVIAIRFIALSSFALSAWRAGWMDDDADK